MTKANNDHEQFRKNNMTLDLSLKSEFENAMVRGFLSDKRSDDLSKEWDALDLRIKNREQERAKLGSSLEDVKSNVSITNSNFEDRNEFNKKLIEACTAEGINLGDEAVYYREAITKSLDRQKEVSKAYLDGLSAKDAESNEVSNKGSLIDDYANPNLEQPGYMDPED